MDSMLMSPIEAILEAVKTTDTEWLKDLLTRFKCDLSEPLLFAARTGDAEAVNLFVKEMFGPKSGEVESNTWDALENAATAAAENGYLEIVRIMLPEFDEYDPCRGVAWRVLDAAAANGHLDIVEDARENTTYGEYSEPDDISSDALSGAIMGGHTTVVSFLLATAQPNGIWDLTEALEKATVNEMLTVAREIVEVYLDNNCGSVETLFVESAESGYVHGVTSITLNKAIEAAAYYGRNKVIALLYKKKGVSSEVINNAFEKAGNVAIFKFLYRAQKNPTKSVVAAFRTASCCGRNNKAPYLDEYNRSAVVEFLSTTGHIPSKLLLEAFTCAIGSRHPKVTTALCNHPNIPSAVIRSAFEKTIDIGDNKVVAILSGDVRIPLAVKCDAFVNASRDGRYNVLKAMCGGALRWPDKTLTEARAVSANAGVRALLLAMIK